MAGVCTRPPLAAERTPAGPDRNRRIRSPSYGRREPPGEHGRGFRRLSDYGKHIREKQRTKHYYGLRERQFRRIFDRAARGDGVTGDEPLRLLERRLDDVLTRLGLAATRRQARQFVSHGHVTFNGRRADIPSYEVARGDVVAIAPGAPVEDLERSPFAIDPAGDRRALRCWFT